MAHAISQLYLEIYQQRNKVNDQNKAGVRLRQFTQIQLRRNLKWSRTSQRQRDIAKIFARKSQEIAKAQLGVKLSNNKPDFYDKLVDSESAMQGKTVVIPN